ncbi:hypothetical protein F5B19DRAFT_440016 [Rostrohypoxylon terebratum]|nr:hypothetical protein F5B19DRAFT_440016 [Rostrohypoxylon terebratum]
MRASIYVLRIFFPLFFPAGGCGRAVQAYATLCYAKHLDTTASQTPVDRGKWRMGLPSRWNGSRHIIPRPRERKRQKIIIQIIKSASMLGTHASGRRLDGDHTHPVRRSTTLSHATYT